MTNDIRSVVPDGLPGQFPDVDADETQEWLDSLDGHIATYQSAASLYKVGLNHLPVPDRRSGLGMNAGGDA